MRFALIAPAALLAPLALPACTGEIIGTRVDGDCSADNLAPDAPTVTAPQAGRKDILPGELALTASPYRDTEGDAHLESEWEIWQTAGGSPTQLVWHALSSEPSNLTGVALSDGSFDVGTDLALDKSYEIKVRYRAGDGCTAWSEWSAPLGFGTDDGSTYFFASEQVRDLYIDLPQASFDAINAQANPPGCVPYERQSYPGKVTFEGVEYPGAGLKTKGGCGSSRDLGGKASWKINLEWDDPAIDGCPAERRLYGLKHLTLNNQVQDGSFVHERLAYHLYRLMGVAVPRQNHVRVNLRIDGQPGYALWGVYLNLETADRTMLGRSFGSNDGMMYEGTYFCDLINTSVPATDGHQDDVGQCLGREFEPDVCSTPDPGADPLDYSTVRQLVAQLQALPAGGYYPEVEAFFDFDAFLSLWAVEAIMNHWDGFTFDIMNNYRIYHDPSTGKWSVIPSGLDQTFTTSRDRSAFAPNNIVARRCLEEPDCKAAFAARLNEALTVFEQAALPAMATTIRDQIAPHVMADPRKPVTYDQFLAQVDATLAFISARPATIRADLAANGF